MPRIPLLGVYNSRIGAISASSASSGIVGIGIVGVMIVGGTPSTDRDQRFINCYPLTVKNQVARTATPYLVKRAGFQASTTPSAGNAGTGLKVWVGNSNKIISAFGTTNSTIYDGTSSLGAITGKCTGITETILSGTANIAVSADNNRAWFYPAGGALTEITDGDFPGQAGRTVVGTFAHLEGYAFIMDSTGRIYNSDINSLSAWTANAFASTNVVPDSGIGCVEYRNHILAFGSRSMEVWYNAGNPSGSPLSRRDEATRLIGLINYHAITKIVDMLAFVGTSNLGALEVYLMDGFEPRRISTPEIESQLTLMGVNDVYVSAKKEAGRTFIVVSGPATTYVYCVEEQLWHEWSSQTPLWQFMDGIASGSSYVTYAVSALSTSGKVYSVNPAGFTYQDDGVAYTATFQLSQYDGGSSDRKIMPSLRVVGDRAGSTSTLSISFSDDDYATWSTVRTVDLSTERPELKKINGSFVRRAVKGTHSANLAMRLEALETDVRKASR